MDWFNYFCYIYIFFVVLIAYVILFLFWDDCLEVMLISMVAGVDFTIAIGFYFVIAYLNEIRNSLKKVV